MKNDIPTVDIDGGDAIKMAHLSPYQSNIVRIIQGKLPYRSTVLGKRRLRVGTNAPT